VRSWETGARYALAERAEAGELRARWRRASLASGWPFPSDWALPEVDGVCETVVGDGVLLPPLRALAAARARADSGLAETLGDLAALHAVLTCPDAGNGTSGLIGVDPDAPPTSLVRPVALAWADVAVGGGAGAPVSDGLTGLATHSYLRMRLDEVYREGGGMPVLATFRLDLSLAGGWSRLVSAVLLADALRSIFDTGETLASLGPSVSAVLARNGDALATRAGLAARLTADRLRADPHLRDIRGPEVGLHTLPATYAEACTVLARLTHPG
jgi:hypothetical protein